MYNPFKYISNAHFYFFIVHIYRNIANIIIKDNGGIECFTSLMITFRSSLFSPILCFEGRDHRKYIYLVFTESCTRKWKDQFNEMLEFTD